MSMSFPNGECRRESYIKVVAEHVDGFESGLIRSLKHTVDDPAVVAPIKRREDLTTGAAKFLLAHTDRKAIVTLPRTFLAGACGTRRSQARCTRRGKSSCWHVPRSCERKLSR